RPAVASGKTAPRSILAASTKDCGADAHQSGALGNGGLVVSAHADRKRIQVGKTARQFFLQLRKRSEDETLLFNILAGRGDGHQATQPQAWHSGNLFAQGGRISQGQPGLAVFPGKIHLHTDVQWRQSIRPLLVEALCDFQSVDAVDPGKMLRDITGLVGLDRPDEVPLDTAVGKALREIADLAQGFLQIVFAKVADRKSTRLNSSHVKISYAVFCLHNKS